MKPALTSSLEKKLEPIWKQNSSFGFHLTNFETNTGRVSWSVQYSLFELIFSIGISQKRKKIDKN